MARLQDIHGQALDHIVALASGGGVTLERAHAIEEWCSEWGRYVSTPIYDRLEALLHEQLCVPEGDCRCRVVGS